RDRGDRRRVRRLPLPRAVEVDDVERGRPLLGELARLGDRVVVEDGGLVEVAAHEAHGAPALQVDGRVERDHAASSTDTGSGAATRDSQRPSSPRPAVLDFSGWNWT